MKFIIIPNIIHSTSMSLFVFSLAGDCVQHQAVGGQCLDACTERTSILSRTIIFSVTL